MCTACLNTARSDCDMLYAAAAEQLSEIAYLIGRDMRIKLTDYRVGPGSEVDLKKRPTAVPPSYRSDREYRDMLNAHVKELGAQQELLYASDRYSLLIVFQGMDAAGKDGAIAHVMSGVNPQGCRVVSFKSPSVGELKHDFLWRTVRELPERGQIGIFNRSYYEEVLIVRVHPEMLRAEGLPHELMDEKRIWRDRYRSIVALERHLVHNGTQVIKFFLHLSKDEQRKRFLKRIEMPEKNWKFSAADIAERQYWRQYTKAYEKCLSATSTHYAPWYVVPADDKANARLIVSRIVLDTLEDLRLNYPKSSAGRRRELRSLRKQLGD
jgi:PPK2 family polyphosphate:nucleotide phosphotransferase